MATKSMQSTAGQLNAAQVAINNTLADPEIQTTHDQDTTLKVLNEWVGQYTRIAKVALHDKKQLLEKLGINARVSKTPAQHAAPQKAAATRAARKQAPRTPA